MSSPLRNRNSFEGDPVAAQSGSPPLLEKQCWGCLDAFAALRKCSRCRTAIYCSPQCQKTNWPFHQTTCFNSADFPIASVDEQLNLIARKIELINQEINRIPSMEGDRLKRLDAMHKAARHCNQKQIEIIEMFLSSPNSNDYSEEYLELYKKEIISAKNSIGMRNLSR